MRQATRRDSRTNRFWALGILLGLLLTTSSAFAQTGVSDDRVSLPEGPGSLEGIGDDVEVNTNMGQMAYSLPVNLPQGYEGLTPDLTLSYSSGEGVSVLGVGWDLAFPSIERLTLRGVPVYDTDDEFQHDGQQLVYVEGSNPREYRARMEGGFVRYRWQEHGDGGEGYWTAEYPDGRIAYFGADADGNLVDTARVGGEDGTFRYLLVEMQDVWSHSIVYTWVTSGSTSLLSAIGYVFADADPIYEVDLTYEARQDWINNATGGFEEITDQRVAEIAVSTRGTVIRRYELDYEDYATSGGFTRLTRMQLYGVTDTAYPARNEFTYSRALGEVCDGVTCEGPFVVEMGTLDSVAFDGGEAQLVDINGDGLADIVDSSLSNAPHRFHLNIMGANGAHAFADASESVPGTRNNFHLAEPFVKVMDVNGDGFTDMVNASTGRVLLNRGTGDWAEEISLGDPGGLDSFSAEWLQVRFLDYNGDRRIDLIRSDGAGDGNITTVYENMGDAGFAATTVNPIGAGFDSDSIEFNDMNGDGLLDIVQVVGTEVRYRINLGWGNWSTCSEGEGFSCSGDWRTASIDGGLDISGGQRASQAEFEDLNGDALTDLVLVEGDAVYVWINRSGREFEGGQVIDSESLGVGLPSNDATTLVLFADMNGNGSSDVVWIKSTGEVTYLELYPVRPNLLSRIENGLGMVIDLTYGTSIEHMARDGGATAWQYRLPFPNIVVDSLDRWDRLTEVHSVINYEYHDGYYDGVEKSFRGYEMVEQHLQGDESQEPGRVVEMFFVTDPYFAGRRFETEVFAEEETESFQVVRDFFGDCDVEGVADDIQPFPIRFICQEANETEFREGLSSDEWRLTRTESTYDGYGNIVLQLEHGYYPLDGAGCGTCINEDGEWGEPCGSVCLGDETYTETDFISPDNTGDRWLLNLPYRDRVYGDTSSNGYAETLTYYDGDAYVGLSEGQATHGFVSRIVQRVTEDGATIEATRMRHDEHGNVVEVIDAEGSIDGDDHRRAYEIDAVGLHVTAVELVLGGGRSLRQDFRYDQIWDQITSSNTWTLYDSGAALTPLNATAWTYDEFGRLASVVQPGGDSLDAPTVDISYDIGSPFSAYTSQTRSAVGGDYDIVKIVCVDGLGRTYQTRDLLTPHT